jgi:hypothetical protein
LVSFREENLQRFHRSWCEKKAMKPHALAVVVFCIFAHFGVASIGVQESHSHYHQTKPLFQAKLELAIAEAILDQAKEDLKDAITEKDDPEDVGFYREQLVDAQKAANSKRAAYDSIVHSMNSLSDKAASSGSTSQTPLGQNRELLRLAEETRARILREREAARAAGRLDAALAADYQTYLDRVERMVATYARMVKEMEALSPPTAIADDPGAGLDLGQKPTATLPAREELDPVLALDRELGQALAEFDKMLLKEQSDIGAKLDEVAQANREQLQELAREAAEAAAKIQGKQGGAGAGQAGEKAGESGQTGEGEMAEAGTKPGTPPGEAGQTAGGQPEKSGAGTAPGDPLPPGEGTLAGGEKTGGTEVVGKPAGGQPSVGTQGGSQAPRRPPADDDDIVARQLREAAEAETDPVLKEKLWKEYDAYKKSTRR